MKPPEPESTPEYEQGRHAQRDGVFADDCPHSSVRGFCSARMYWFIGWYDERNKHLLEGP